MGFAAYSPSEIAIAVEKLANTLKAVALISNRF